MSSSYTIVELQQGTPEWRNWRNNGIGASDAPIIMGENPWNRPAQLLSEKIGTTKGFEGNAATARGAALEPEARKLYEASNKVRVSPVCLQSNRYEWQRASVDGLAADGSVGQIQATGRGSRGGLHSGVDGRSDARLGEGRDRAHRFAFPGAGVREWQFPCANPAAEARRGELRYGKSDFERRHYALLGLMCIYGIELLPDNIVECRANLLEIFAEYLGLAPTDDLYRAAFGVLAENLVHGDALTMRTHDGQPITFAEWGYLGKGRFQRRDFPVRQPHPVIGLQRGGVAFRPPRHARDLHAGQNLPADVGRRAGRRRPGGDAMSEQASFTLRRRNPDVLTCIANLSNDEVFTPPEFANRMLDTLAEAWAANQRGRTSGPTRR
jgi:putative phage-type endonuclease